MGVPVANSSDPPRSSGTRMGEKCTQLETAVFFPAYLASHITHQAVKDIYALEIINEPRVLGLALL